MIDETMEKQPIPNGVGALETGIGALPGLTIEAVTTMPSSVKRESNHFLLMRGKDAEGIPRRIIVGYVEVKSPAPDDIEMSKDRISGIKFFTEEEVFTRRTGGQLFDNTGTKVPQATTQERLEKIPQWAEQVTGPVAQEQDDE